MHRNHYIDLLYTYLEIVYVYLIMFGQTRRLERLVKYLIHLINASDIKKNTECRPNAIDISYDI